jgi:hypothetical protein
MTAAPISDVRAHMHLADLAENPDLHPDSGVNPARGAARARVIPLRPEHRQDPAPENDRGLDGGLAAGLQAVREAAEDSDLARAPMTVWTAFEQLAPAKGEASGKLVWTAMTFAGLLRLIYLAVGHLVAKGGETRIRAAVATGVLTAAVVVSWALGHAA